MRTPARAIDRTRTVTTGLPAALAGDERLARLASAGSERAFAVLYDRYHQRLYRYVRAMLRHDADAQDALQSAFAKAFSALVADRRDAPLRPWLYRIAHNEAVSVIRRRRPEVGLGAAAEQTSRSAAEEANERARLSQLVSDLAQLTERQRGALVMRELSGLTHAEIDVALALDPGGAKQTIFEARRSLGEFAAGRAMTCDDVSRAISDGGGRTLRGRRIRAHLRDCAGCAAFAAAIPARSRELRAIAPPLPAAAAAGLLARALNAGSGSAAGGSAAGGPGFVAVVAGKAVGLTSFSKAVAALALVAVAGVGAGTGGLVTLPVIATGHAPPARVARAGAGAGTRHNRRPGGHAVVVANPAGPTPAIAPSPQSRRGHAIAGAHKVTKLTVHGDGHSGHAFHRHRGAGHGRRAGGPRGHHQTASGHAAGGPRAHGQNLHRRISQGHGTHSSPARSSGTHTPVTVHRVVPGPHSTGAKAVTHGSPAGPKLKKAK